MDWHRGYSARFTLVDVDPGAWDADGGDAGLIHSADLDFSDEDMMQSGSVELDVADVGEKWVRLWMEAAQRGGGERVCLATMLTASPSREAEGDRTTYDVELNSVLKPCADRGIRLPYQVAAGADPAVVAGGLLAGSTPAPVAYRPSGKALTSPMNAESGETRLSMARKLLEKCGYVIAVTPMGHIVLGPASTDVVCDIGDEGYDAVIGPIKTTDDWYSLPNVYVVEVSDGESTYTVTARDDHSERLGVQARGREIWQTGSWSENDDGTAASAAAEGLAEAQDSAVTQGYTREYLPDVVVGSLIRLRDRRHGIDGTYRVVSQRLSCGCGATVEEEVEQA